MKYIPKEMPSGINVTHRHSLYNFAYLLGTVVIISVLIFVLLGFVADWLSNRISPETENKIGQMLLPVIMDDNEILEDKRIQYIEKLLYSLQDSEETLRLPLTVHLIKTDVLNAAITVGGHVFVHTELLETVKSENELAFILAHELGHFQARDPLRALGRSLIFMFASATLGFTTSESGGVSDIVSMTSDLSFLNYSRKQESAADLYALSRVINRYGHGDHSLDFFKLLESQERQNKLLKVSKYFLTHPLSKDRIDALTSEAVKQGWKMEGEATPLPK